MAAALAVLCGRSLSVSTLRQFASADKSHNSRCNFQHNMHVRMGQLENLERALAKMEAEELRKARLAAAAAAAAAVAAAAAAAADTTTTAASTTGSGAWAGASRSTTCATTPTMTSEPFLPPTKTVFFNTTNSHTLQ